MGATRIFLFLLLALPLGKAHAVDIVFHSLDAIQDYLVAQRENGGPQAREAIENAYGPLAVITKVSVVGPKGSLKALNRSISADGHKITINSEHYGKEFVIEGKRVNHKGAQVDFKERLVIPGHSDEVIGLTKDGETSKAVSFDNCEGQDPKNTQDS